MEEEERREDHPGGSHEAEGPGSRGESARFGFSGDVKRGNGAGRGGRERAGAGRGGGKPHPDTDKHRSTWSPSPGCNGDSHMLQPARVSKESYQETMQHNNSFPSEAGGVEPIVCTLLKLWMLPLLQRAYINLAGSQQRCAASVPSPRLTSLPAASGSLP